MTGGNKHTVHVNVPVMNNSGFTITLHGHMTMTSNDQANVGVVDMPSLTDANPERNTDLSQEQDQPPNTSGKK